ncbi:hypothetical protein IFO69_14435 [Echinicola sp. CAU 1574]|uniref:Uncharacterized protein n=1 Tax=Echinicola arenosa TaxID=2774144 RepID=A0ABR9ANR1_9BACT|nr:hypothetical protein [Echinicola arenosa]MBD8489951.1 hypothetical protein [Echinicola arenosa]
MKTDLKVLILLSVLWIKIMAAPIVFIDFKIQQERLALEECIERYATITVCRANCVLKTKIQLTTDTKEKKKSVKTSKYQEWIFIEDIPSFSLYKPRRKSSGYLREHDPSRGFVQGIDEPPQVNVSDS